MVERNLVMSNPIGDAAEKSIDRNHPLGLPVGDKDENRPEVKKEVKKVDLNSETSAVLLLTQVQNAFIKAQTAFIHDKDLGALATAQENHIEGLTAVLEKMGVI
jgi:hypothetical protein